MRISAPVTLIAICTPLLCHCGTGSSSISSRGASNPGYGPFDRHGNYVEEWADKPAKKHRWASKPKPAPVKEEPVVASTSTPQSKPPTRTTRSTEVASLDRSRTTTTRTTRPPAPAPKPTPTVASTPPKPKPTPPPKPSRSHTVVKGDTLYNLSRRYGTSISSIQRANGISGTTIRLGQKLKIP